MTEPAIFLDRLSKSYRDIHAIECLSLSITPRTILGFLGSNGAGETTTSRMLCGSRAHAFQCCNQILEAFGVRTGIQSKRDL